MDKPKSKDYKFLDVTLPTEKEREEYLQNFKFSDNTIKVIDVVTDFVLHGGKGSYVMMSNVNEIFSLGQIAERVFQNLLEDNKDTKTSEDCWICTNLIMDEIKLGINEFIDEYDTSTS